MPNPILPFDTTGTATANLIQGELHSLTEINARTYRIIIPTFAPFYLHNLLIEHLSPLGVAQPLVEGVDFYSCLPYMAASRSTGKAVYGGLSILSDLPQGTLRIRYQALGGEWCADTAYVYNRLLESVYNRRSTWWDVVTNVQAIFPPTEHEHPAGDIDGMTDLLTRLETIRAAITTAAGNAPANYIQHLLARGNPHQLERSDLGLEDVLTYPQATDDEVVSLARLDKTVTLRQILLLLDQFIVS